VGVTSNSTRLKIEELRTRCADQVAADSYRRFRRDVGALALDLYYGVPWPQTRMLPLR
jgi:hypothetical protein